jgi:hypothetical protein
MHDQAWHYLLGLAPDLAFLQETLPPAWVRSEGTLVHGPFTQWGSVIFSPRYPIERFRLPAESNLNALGAYLAFGIASLPDGSEGLIASVHARHGKATPAQLRNLDPAAVKRPSGRVPLVNDAIFAGLVELVGERFVVAGDWNTARVQGTERASKIGTEFFDRTQKRRWYDCVWEKRQGEVRTWFGRGEHIRQDDHAFCDPGLGERLEGVWVAEDAATHLGLSDHAPLILDFTVDPIAMTSLGESSRMALADEGRD